MKKSVVAAMVLLLVGCTSAITAAPARPTTIVLRVISASDNATRIPGAEVFTVGNQGTLSRVGATDTFGEIRIDRSALSTRENAIAIVVCHPVFFCGALRADYVAPRDEMTLALAIAVTD
jgi:hypothetical protein